MTNQPFPGLTSKVMTPDGTVTPVWRAFFQTLWDRTGASNSGGLAPSAGSPNQTFAAAPAASPLQVVTLGQATGLYQPKGAYAARSGSIMQAFDVGTALVSSNAVNLSQANAIAATAVAPLAPQANPVFSGVVSLPVYTVATLPAGSSGAVAFVSDATARTFGTAPTGSGTLGVPVFYGGAGWLMG